jgi:hypothetical protein
VALRTTGPFADEEAIADRVADGLARALPMLTRHPRIHRCWRQKEKGDCPLFHDYQSALIERV